MNVRRGNTRTEPELGQTGQHGMPPASLGSASLKLTGSPSAVGHGRPRCVSRGETALRASASPSWRSVRADLAKQRNGAEKSRNCSKRMAHASASPLVTVHYTLW